jgi:hypothetical protein
MKVKVTLTIMLFSALASATSPMIIPPQSRPPVVKIKSPDPSPILQSFTGPIIIPPKPSGGGPGPAPTCPPPKN